MNVEIYRYQFNKGVPMQDVEESLHLAILAAECLHGQSRVRLDASYCMDADKCACVIDATTQVGQDVNRIFTGFAIREFGEDAFKVERVQRTDARERAGAGPEGEREGPQAVGKAHRDGGHAGGRL